MKALIVLILIISIVLGISYANKKKYNPKQEILKEDIEQLEKRIEEQGF